MEFALNAHVSSDVRIKECSGKALNRHVCFNFQFKFSLQPACIHSLLIPKLLPLSGRFHLTHLCYNCTILILCLMLL